LRGARKLASFFYVQNKVASLKRSPYLKVSKLKNMKRKTNFEMWLDGELTNLGSFATSLLETYMKADGANRAKLEATFPEWFK
jgi:hypothetical protein